VVYIKDELKNTYKYINVMLNVWRIRGKFMIYLINLDLLYV